MAQARIWSVAEERSVLNSFLVRTGRIDTPALALGRRLSGLMCVIEMPVQPAGAEKMKPAATHPRRPRGKTCGFLGLPSGGWREDVRLWNDLLSRWLGEAELRVPIGKPAVVSAAAVCCAAPQTQAPPAPRAHEKECWICEHDACLGCDIR